MTDSRAEPSKRNSRLCLRSAAEHGAVGAKAQDPFDPFWDDDDSRALPFRIGVLLQIRSILKHALALFGIGYDARAALELKHGRSG